VTRAQRNARTLQPAALAFVPYGFVLVRVRVRAHGRLQPTIPVRAKTRRQTIIPDGTPGLLCLRNPGRRQTAKRFARDDKVLEPQLGENNFPENGLVKPPSRGTRALRPAGMFIRMAPLRLAARKNARAISALAQYACILSLRKGGINLTILGRVL
jgi:hypothetical protein